MNISVIFFGQLTDITNSSKIKLIATDTDTLLKNLYDKFPGLRSAKFIVAVNNNKIEQNQQLDNNAIVALMPPFSGG